MEQKAEELKKRGLDLLNSPGALMLPKPVRNLIADLLSLVAEIAKRDCECDCSTAREDLGRGL